ncbi:MAG: class I SAM-dependent methyltransferase [Gammaproteobacteria bacterium]|nr:class I SAM-dependent methyltransferase [Gammaproteobacteria bacterium]
MKKVEPVVPEIKTGLTRQIQDFWTRRVNAEYLMGKAVTTHARGDDAYFQDLETQRYRSHRHLPPWIAAMTPGRTVLEIGSGVGLDTFTMARHGLQVTAVDLTEVAVATAQQRFLRHAIAADFLVADACHLPFPENCFDYVYSFGVLHHVADTEASIHEVHRLLKPGGQARIMLYHRYSLNELAHRLLKVPFEDRDELCPVVRRFTVAEVRALFREFRHTEVSIEYVYGEGYGRLFALTPRWLYDRLSQHWGWHLMIAATK